MAACWGIPALARTSPQRRGMVSGPRGCLDSDWSLDYTPRRILLSTSASRDENVNTPKGRLAQYVPPTPTPELAPAYCWAERWVGSSALERWLFRALTFEVFSIIWKTTPWATAFVW